MVRMAIDWKLSEELAGVIFGYQNLQASYGTPVLEPLIYGGIIPSDNIKAYWVLPLRFRIYRKPQKLDSKVHVEGRGVWARCRIWRKSITLLKTTTSLGGEKTLRMMPECLLRMGKGKLH